MCLFARLAILMILLIDTNMVRMRYFNDLQIVLWCAIFASVCECAVARTPC